ncbi:MAG: helix-turn-helix domain-containing protein [Lachnospiraceae bacterium]|nr:helix-turn-helix domain-containing protein [Lachnospiraceae bacterium]
MKRNHASKELAAHGTLEFPCAGYSTFFTDLDDCTIPWHWHEEIEILYIKKGSVRLQIPGKSFYLNQGEGAAVSSNVLHFLKAEAYCELYSLVFHPMLVMGNEESVFARKYMKPLLENGVFDGCCFTWEEQGSYEAKFVAAFEALMSGKTGYEFSVRNYLSEICCLLYRKFEKNLDENSFEANLDSERIQKMLQYIHKHFAEELTVSQIAGAADIGNRECLRCFQRMIQISPIQYLLKYRIMQSASLLAKNPAYNISDIASQCGFDSPSNFSQMFKRFYRCSPREYRKHRITADLQKNGDRRYAISNDTK